MGFLPLNVITKRQCVRMLKMNFEILLIGRSCSCYRFIANQNVKFNTYYKWKIYYHRWWTFNVDSKGRTIVIAWTFCCWLQYDWMPRKRCPNIYQFSSKISHAYGPILACAFKFLSRLRFMDLYRCLILLLHNWYYCWLWWYCPINYEWAIIIYILCCAWYLRLRSNDWRNWNINLWCTSKRKGISCILSAAARRMLHASCIFSY